MDGDCRTLVYQKIGTIKLINNLITELVWRYSVGWTQGYHEIVKAAYKTAPANTPARATSEVTSGRLYQNKVNHFVHFENKFYISNCVDK